MSRVLKKRFQVAVKPVKNYSVFTNLPLLQSKIFSEKSEIKNNSFSDLGRLILRIIINGYGLVHTLRNGKNAPSTSVAKFALRARNFYKNFCESLNPPTSLCVTQHVNVPQRSTKKIYPQ